MTKYSPSSEVFASHNIPVFDQNLRPIQVDFSFSLEYLQSLIIFPAFVFIICTAIVCLFYFAALCWGFFHHMNCCRRNLGAGSDENPSAEEKIYRRTQFERTFFLSLFSTACIACFLFLGSARISAALTIIADGIYQLGDLTTRAVTFVGNILHHIVMIRQLLSAPICANFNPVLLIETKVDLQLIEKASNSLNDVGYKVLSSLHSLEYALRYAVIAKKHLAVGILCALILLAVALQCLSLLLRSVIFMCFAAGVTFLVVLILLLVGSVMMVPVKALGDFCMDPNNNLLTLFHGILARVVSFYLTCSGNSGPLQKEIELMDSVIADAERVLLQAKQSIHPQCYEAVQSNYSSITSNLSSLSELLSCPGPHRIYSETVLGGVCSDAATGLYSIWLLVFLLAAFLFVALCLGNIIYAHYGLHLQTLDAVGEGDVNVNVNHGAEAAVAVVPQISEGQVIPVRGLNREESEGDAEKHRPLREIEMI